MANELLVIDLKAPGLSSESYPISIGVAGPGDQVWSWLVCPLEDWVYWDVSYDSVHGLRRSQLLEQGRDGYIICREMNAIFKGFTLVTLSRWTGILLTKLYRDLGVRMSFSLVDLLLVEGEDMMPQSDIASVNAVNMRSLILGRGLHNDSWLIDNLWGACDALHLEE